jgi:hypothetical protein
VTGEEKLEIRLGGAPDALAAGADAVWAAVPDQHAVVRYQIAGRRLETIDVGGRPADLVFADGSLWVAVHDEPTNEGALASNGRDAVDGVRFSFSVPAPNPYGWETGHPPEPLHDNGEFSGFRSGSHYISKFISGGQDAEAVIFWPSFPAGEQADPCPNLPSPRVGVTAADLAAAVAAAPGTELVAGPSDVTVGGQPAKHVVLIVRDDLGCDPGYFYTFETHTRGDECWGACWGGPGTGDTIRVWIVDVDGTPFVIEAETRPNAGSAVEQEIQQIVDSIRFL